MQKLEIGNRTYYEVGGMFILNEPGANNLTICRNDTRTWVYAPAVDKPEKEENPREYRALDLIDLTIKQQFFEELTSIDENELDIVEDLLDSILEKIGK